MHEYIKCELAKCLDTLAQTSPKSEEYSRILGGLHNIYTLTECIEECISVVESDSTAPSNVGVIEFPKAETPIAEEETPFTEPEVFTPHTVENPTPTEEELNEIEELNETPPVVNRKITKDELREALVKARMEKGVNVAALVRKYGVSNLTALPEDKYAAVMAELENL